MGTVLLVLKWFFIIFLELVCFLSCRYFVYERYLAAKTGTNSVVFLTDGFLFPDDILLVLFFVLFVFNELSSGRDD